MDVSWTTILSSKMVVVSALQNELSVYEANCETVLLRAVLVACLLDLFPTSMEVSLVLSTASLLDLVS